MNLIIIRHAKSSWKQDVEDHDRPLTFRGINDAQLVFKQISSYLPKEYNIWCSTSKRTMQTAKIFCTLNDVNFEDIIFKKELYTFSYNNFENIIKKNRVKNLIIFGHNNAITDFVNKFGNNKYDNIPTCGVVIIKFDELNKFTSKNGIIARTVFPKDLK